jgi:hypothetical protein
MVPNLGRVEAKKMFMFKGPLEGGGRNVMIEKAIACLCQTICDCLRDIAPVHSGLFEIAIWNLQMSAFEKAAVDPSSTCHNSLVYKP